MSFPIDPLPIKCELLIANAWTDVTSYVRNAGDVGIERAFRSEQGNSITTDVCNFNLNNRDGRFSNRNPLSPYYGLLPKNTNVRFSIEDVHGNSLVLNNKYYPSDGYAYTTDKAVLDITSDIDIRGDCYPDSWTPTTSQVLASKFAATSNQRSWYVALTADGELKLAWSANGSTILSATSSVAVPSTSGRLAWRVTLDVNNGAAGNTATFYTSDTISGSWTQLGTTVVQGGTTSIFSSTANLAVGSGYNGELLESNVPFRGFYYRFQLYNGIGGTLVADANFGAQTIDEAAWSDGLGTPNVWALPSSLANIVPGTRRWYGEVSEFPQVWDSTGTDIYVPVSSSSVMRRVGQGEEPLEGSMRRYIKSKTTVRGYWPMDSAATTSTTSSGISNGNRAYFKDVTFGTDADLPSVDGVATLTSADGNIKGYSNVSSNSTVATGFLLFRYSGTLPTIGPEMIRFSGNGTVKFWTVSIDNTAFYVAGFDAAGGVLGGVVTGNWTAGVSVGTWIGLRLQVTTSGGNIAVAVDWHKVGVDTTTTVTDSAYCAGSVVGRFTDFEVNPVGESENDALVVTQITILQESLASDDAAFMDATDAFTGEAAGTRFLRECEAAGIDAWIIGDPEDTITMGPEPRATLTTVLQECGDVDGGFIFAPRDFLGLAMRTRKSMLNQAKLELDYASQHFDGVLRPTDDDKILRNDVTITRPAGGEATDTDEENIALLGRYDTSYPLNAESPDQLPGLAQYATFLGTWDELRYPQTTVSLQRAVFVADLELSHRIAQLDIGDAYQIVNLPSWLPPGPAELLLRGTTETLQNRGWVHTWNTQSYGPFKAADLNPDNALGLQRLDATNSTLAADITSSDTAVVVRTPTGVMWRRSSGAVAGTFPMDVTFGGEEASLTAVANVTMSFVAAGTAAHADNASVSPGLPAGLATGDLMLMIAAIRTTSASVTTPSGWEALTTNANFTLFGRIAQASGNAPTVAFTGGAAGADTSAQICAFRPSSAFAAAATTTEFFRRARWLTNASAQDITYPALLAEDQFKDNGIVLYLGWKQDDWTSVASPGTEIGEPDTATGNDQGLVWAYTIQTTKAVVATGSFVVTGGASAVSKGAVCFIHPQHQVFTLDRSENGIVKGHDAETDINVLNPIRVQL
jgi:hypothetical protein